MEIGDPRRYYDRKGKHIPQSYGVLHERLFSGKRKMVRVITEDEREENIYVLNYLSYYAAEMFEWKCSNVYKNIIGDCAIYRYAVILQYPIKQPKY